MGATTAPTIGFTVNLRRLYWVGPATVAVAVLAVALVQRIGAALINPIPPAFRFPMLSVEPLVFTTLVGTLVLTGVMLGVGYGMIWSLFTRGEVPKLDGIGPYLLGGSALFAPYAFNQLKEAFRPKTDATQ
jgi:hypothetical protein